MATQTRLIDSAAVKRIMQRRKLVPTAKVGKKGTFTIQGSGNVVDVKDKEGKLVLSTIPGQEGTVLQKRILNTNTVSQLAMSNARTRQYYIDGLAAEKAGDKEKASELFNQYLNSTQVSFGILLPNKTADLLTQGVDISAEVIQITTPNGSLLSLDPATIAIMAPEVFGNVTFNEEDFIPAEVASVGAAAVANM